MDVIASTVGARQSSVDTALFQNLQQCSQLVTIPLLQGFFEGLVDSCNIGYASKSLLKFIPRITLFVLGYTSFLSCGMAALASVLTDFMRENLEDFTSKKFENYIQLLFFLVVTELEYAPSNLWQVSGQIEIFPETMTLLNKLLVQMALAPAFKTGAYLVSQSLIKCLMTCSTEESKKQQKTSLATDFFSALRVARETVFSRKIVRPFAFFASPAANNPLSQVSEDIPLDRVCMAKTA